MALAIQLTMPCGIASDPAAVAESGPTRHAGSMHPTVVLVHSPSVGPLTWTPVAARLATDPGWPAIVPSLLDVADAGPPFWPRVVELVTAAMADLPAGTPTVLIAHSNAGLFLPAVVHAAPRPVQACLFVDAGLPARVGPTPMAPPEFLDHLRGMAIDGRLPPWTDWWGEDEIAPMFPDAPTRTAVSAEQPRLPLAYYEQRVPVPAGWDDRPCGYLVFGEPYHEAAAEAARRGWPVVEVPGRHLHQIVDPETVTRRLVALVRRLLTDG